MACSRASAFASVYQVRGTWRAILWNEGTLHVCFGRLTICYLLNLIAGNDHERSPSVALTELDKSDNNVIIHHSTTYSPQRIILYVEFAGSSSLPAPCWPNQFTKVNILAFGVLVKSV